MQRIVEALIAVIVSVDSRRVVGMVLQRSVADWVLFRSLWKQLVGNAHFDVVGFAGEHRQRFVLRLPAEARDGAVVPAAVRYALYP